MWTCNFGVHDCSTDKGYMHMWPESTASRDSMESFHAWTYTYRGPQVPLNSPYLVMHVVAKTGTSILRFTECKWYAVGTIHTQQSITTLWRRIIATCQMIVILVLLKRPTKDDNTSLFLRSGLKYLKLVEGKIPLLLSRWTPQILFPLLSSEHILFIVKQTLQRRRWSVLR